SNGALIALAPQGNHLGVIVGVLVATAVSFIVAAFILKTGKATEEDLAEATETMVEKKGKKCRATGSKQEENKEAEENRSEKIPETVNKVICACDARMGSSAMGSSLLKNKFKKENLAIEVNNSAINQIPDDADIVITHKNLTDR